MSSFTLSGIVQFAPKLVDGIATWASSTSRPLTLVNGTAAGQANATWQDVFTIEAGDSETIDLLSLPFTALGGSGTVSLASIKLLAVANDSANVTLTVVPGDVDGWDQLGGVYVGKGGTLLFFSPVEGFPVGASTKTVKITNDGTVTTLTGDTTSGSAAVVGISDTSGLAAGMAVSGTGVPAGTKIASITNGTSLVMTANATATSGSGGTSLDFQWPAASVSVYAVGVAD